MEEISEGSGSSKGKRQKVYTPTEQDISEIKNFIGSMEKAYEGQFVVVVF